MIIKSIKIIVVIVIKRIKKYFPGREATFVPAIFDNPENGGEGV